MAVPGGRIRINEGELQRILTSRAGPVARRLEDDAERVTQEQKRLCPVSPVGASDHPSGQLRSAIGWEMHEDIHGLVVRAGVDPSSPANDYAIPVEVGTQPHTIESHGDYPLRNPKTGQVFGKSVNHPGTDAQPFIRPSLDVLR